MTEYEIILDEFIDKLPPLTVKVMNVGGLRDINCGRYFMKSEIAEIRAMFKASEGYIDGNVMALHKIRVWLKDAAKVAMTEYRSAHEKYGGQSWQDLTELVGEERLKARRENNRLDPHIRVAARAYYKLIKIAEIEIVVEQNHSWLFRNFLMAKEG